MEYYLCLYRRLIFFLFPSLVLFCSPSVVFSHNLLCSSTHVVVANSFSLRSPNYVLERIFSFYFVHVKDQTILFSSSMMFHLQSLAHYQGRIYLPRSLSAAPKTPQIETRVPPVAMRGLLTGRCQCENYQIRPLIKRQFVEYMLWYVCQGTHANTHMSTAMIKLALSHHTPDLSEGK